MTRAIPITPEMRVHLMHAETLTVDVPLDLADILAWVAANPQHHEAVRAALAPNENCHVCKHNRGTTCDPYYSDAAVDMWATEHCEDGEPRRGAPACPRLDRRTP